MAVRLTIAEDGDAGSRYVRTLMQDRIVIGRSRSCDVCLPDMAISTRHAEIRLRGTEYVLTDLESLNGSTVNDKPVLSFQSRKLQSGDVIRAAGFTMHVELGVPPGPDEARDVSIRHAREILSRAASRTGEVSPVRTFTVVGGPNRGARLRVDPGEGRAVIGRSSDLDLPLEDRDVSRVHAEILVRDDKVVVRDLESKNGVYYQDVRVPSAELTAGESFIVGQSIIQLDHPADSLLGSIFEAPEEETASFSIVTPPPAEREEPAAPQKTFRVSNATGTSPEESAEKTAPYHGVGVVASSDSAPVREETPGIGPADPLVDSVAPSAAPAHPKLPPPGTDIGLIAVGIVLLAAAVIGLAYLFH